MSALDAWIGSLEDEDFHWEGGNWSGNVPQRRSPFLPNGPRAFAQLIRKINQGEIDGKQTDWGGFVARVTRAQIIDFMAELAGTGQLRAGLNEELMAYVYRLDEHKLYALVAVEQAGDEMDLVDDPDFTL